MTDHANPAGPKLFASLAEAAHAGQPAVLATTAAVMALGLWLPFSPLAPAVHLEPLPAGFFVYLPAVLLAYCLLTQLAKVLYIRRFKVWL